MIPADFYLAINFVKLVQGIIYFFGIAIFIWKLMKITLYRLSITGAESWYNLELLYSRILTLIKQKPAGILRPYRLLELAVFGLITAYLIVV